MASTAPHVPSSDASDALDAPETMSQPAEHATQDLPQPSSPVAIDTMPVDEMPAAIVDSSVSAESPKPPQSPARSESPSPSVAPSLALDAVPGLDHRSISLQSSSEGSTLSTRSRYSRRSDGGATVVHRRGYMRPQGTSFADSARNRDSVMSLGSIAHMQYYFARTGLLDGKGGQLAKEKKRGLVNVIGHKESTEPSTFSMYDFGVTSLSLSTQDASSNYAISDSGIDPSIVESPSDLQIPGEPWTSSPDSIMLPPTVSTYKVKPEVIEPLPDLPVLRRELKEALQDACKVLEESQKPALIDGQPPAENSGFYEVQGLHMLDITTLAIRAAKNYYTAHSNPQKLYLLRSEKLIRADLYQVLDTLKRMASRNFRGGIRINELTEIITWIESIDQLLKKEEAQEQQEAAERESWVWRDGDWTGREREREWSFLKSFDATEPSLSQWPESTAEQSYPSAFLQSLQDGQRLVRLHNALVARSKRRFGEIKTFHTDVAKPYRMTENLQYWVKAAELRWDTPLTVPVSDVVNNKDQAAWKAFDEAVLKWSQSVRTELMEEWLQDTRAQERRRPPEVKVENAGMPDEAKPETAEVPAEAKPETAEISNDAEPEAREGLEDKIEAAEITSDAAPIST